MWENAVHKGAALDSTNEPSSEHKCDAEIQACQPRFGLLRIFQMTVVATMFETTRSRENELS
jgi:hypothetical protein